MAQITYRANLKTASFPFLSELFGRSIIVKQQDQNSVRALSPGNLEGDEQGIPQLYYCHNVVPTSQGYKSVDYTSLIGTQYPGGNFTNRVPLRDSTGNAADLAVDASGNLYIRIVGTAIWIVPAGAPAAATIAGKFITTAFVSGTTYIYFANVACYIYTFATNTMAIQALAGLVAADILGLVANRGYNVAYTKLAVLWSSTTDPTDFVPSLITGAGGGQVEGARGPIVSVGSVYGGMIVFTTVNAIAGVYSSNSRFPFNFIEVSGAGGITDPNFVSYDGNNPSLYAYTTAGLQLITLRDSTNVFPDVTDFISGGLLEDFDEISMLFTLQQTSAILQKKLVLIGNRYLVISYGIASLTHALLYDITLKQFGRLKFTHVDCYEKADGGTTEIAKKSIAFLGAGGELSILNTDIFAPNSSGVMIVGKFQFVRTRLLQLEKAQLENINSGNTFNCYDLPSMDGKNFGAAIVGYKSIDSGKYREYMFHNTALNHSILWIGNFHANSMQLVFNVHGNR